MKGYTVLILFLSFIVLINLPFIWSCTVFLTSSGVLFHLKRLKRNGFPPCGYVIMSLRISVPFFHGKKKPHARNKNTVYFIRD